MASVPMADVNGHPSGLPDGADSANHCRACGEPGHNIRTCQRRARLASPPDVDPALPVEPTPAVAKVRRHLRVIDGRVRSKTIPARRLSQDEVLEHETVEYPADVERPRTRGDCANMPRPCPFVSCSHHLYLDSNPETGALKLNFPHLEVWEMAETCSLDVADRGGITLEEVGRIFNLTRERIRQVELRGLEKIRAENGDALGVPEEQDRPGQATRAAPPCP